MGSILKVSEITPLFRLSFKSIVLFHTSVGRTVFDTEIDRDEARFRIQSLDAKREEEILSSEWVDRYM